MGVAGRGHPWKTLLLPPQDRFVLHSSPGDGKQMVPAWGGEVSQRLGDLPSDQPPGGMGGWVYRELAGDGAPRYLRNRR